ncbi:uncharacterized protein B0H18DRAFT_1105243 [Fomitopsis serialis]|uniref:uncharacterized protein n=1 Tax=Fomitopsis serialis TaxID=139415 RepID=UPI002007C9DA|nr:uncharacterized protein B0H18DRAFT_1105243 [Neoantrodia serialis]KAH9923615.1 hypothetical protein B0H18DRAFT_1105243 [Neoantrodia serialis]
MDSDDDAFLYGESKEVAETAQPPVETSEPQPISLEQTQSVSQGLVATLEAEAAGSENADGTPEAPEPKEEEEPETGGGGEEEEEEEESDDDIEIIMDQPSRSLDLRQQNGRPPPNRTASTSTPVRLTDAPPPSLTTEYTPRERGSLTKLPTPQPSSAQSPRPSQGQAGPAGSQNTADGQQQADGSGPDPSTLPVATAPPSHPSINPAIPGTLDGRSILEVDLAALADKPWRRPGSDLSDWFNYGFDEISWEAYCFRRRELGEVASVLKNNVLNFAGMPEDQLSNLPPEIRTMVIAGSTAMMNGGEAAAPVDMGMGMGEMGMGMGGGPGMQMGMGGGGGGPGMQMGMMQGEGAGAGGMGGGTGPGAQSGSGGQPNPEGGMGMGEGFGPGASGPGQGQGQGMMGMGGGDFSMQQDPSSMGQQMGQQPGQQMFGGAEGTHTPAPTSTPTPTRGGGPMPGQFRGRGMPPTMSARGRAAYAPRGRVPARPASPLPPNVPTGPRNKTKYRDIDGSAQPWTAWIMAAAGAAAVGKIEGRGAGEPQMMREAAAGSGEVPLDWTIVGNPNGDSLIPLLSSLRLSLAVPWSESGATLRDYFISVVRPE